MRSPRQDAEELLKIFENYIPEEVYASKVFTVEYLNKQPIDYAIRVSKEHLETLENINRFIDVRRLVVHQKEVLNILNEKLK